MRGRRRLFFAVLLALAALLAASPAATKIDPKTALKGFDAFVSSVMAEWKVPGLAAAAIVDGQIVCAAGFGERDVVRKLKVTPHTLFGIGSCSKAFTAVTMGVLADEGKLDWDKPVREYLPSFELADPIISERATPRDLVTHKTGMPRHDNVWIRSPLSRRELFDRLRYLELNKDLRQAYQYNNLMFMTAGFLVGEIAGTSWEDFARRRILEPLGLSETNFSVTDLQKAQDFSRSYTLVHDAVEEFPFYSVDALGPAGSINSSVLDMARWVQLNIDGGKFGGKLSRSIVSEKQMDLIHSPQTVVPDDGKTTELFYSSYGVGWRINSYRGHPMLSHGGAIMGYSAMTAFLPRDRIGIVLLNNLEDAPINGILAYNIVDRLLGLELVDWRQRVRDEIAKAREDALKSKAEREKDRKPGTAPSHPLADYAGDFDHPAYGTISIKLDAAAGLQADYHQRTFVLEPYHYDIFLMKNDWMDAEYLVTFTTDLKGHISALSVPFEPSVKDIVFCRRPAAKEEKK